MITCLRKLPKDSVYSCINSPLGRLGLVASEDGLRAILWEKDLADNSDCQRLLAGMREDKSFPVIKAARKQLKEYFAGDRKAFDLPLVMEGTEFQKKAWKQLCKIPYGETISYQEQAKKIGDIKKARAVGMANSRNPISIIVPCHRVISKNGQLNGFGGGVEKKGFLLNLEKAH